jgi:hypothetical protein
VHRDPDDRVAAASHGRPESLALATQRNGDRPAGIAGRIEDVSFLGSIVRIRVLLDADGGSVLVDQFNDRGWSLLTPGDRVSLSFPEDAALRLDRRDDGARASTTDSRGSQPAIDDHAA